MFSKLFTVWGPDPAYKMPEENSEKGEFCNNCMSKSNPVLCHENYFLNINLYNEMYNRFCYFIF
jgi:hypothetical protein